MTLLDAVADVTGARPKLVSLEDAQYALCTGLRNDEIETLDDYQSQLQAMSVRGMAMICANPDIVIHRGDTLIYCAGALARRYEELGGSVVYAGKPYAPIYDRALALHLNKFEARRSRSLACSRSETACDSVIGASRAQLDVFFVTGGIRRSLREHAGVAGRPDCATTVVRRKRGMAGRRHSGASDISGKALALFQTLYFDDLAVGMRATIRKTVENEDVIHFAELSGDHNPIHLSEHFARKTRFGGRIVHGLYTASLISGVIGMRLPGPGAVYISQTLNFRGPVKIGDLVDVSVEVAELTEKNRRVRLHCECRVGDFVVLDGEGVLSVPPTPKLRPPAG